MIIIEGRVGKSRILEEIINDRLQNRNVVVLDTVGVKGLVCPKGVDHFMYDVYDSKSALDIYKTGRFDGYDWVIFEINIDAKDFDIGEFMDIDRNSTQNFIVTVQTDSDIKVKFA